MGLSSEKKMIHLPPLNAKEIDWCQRQAEITSQRGKQSSNHLALYKTTSLENDAHSFGAEFSLAKALGFETPNGSESLDNADIGKWVQVKWNKYPNGDLLIPCKSAVKKPPQRFIYCLVYGKPWDGYSFIGWIKGREAMEAVQRKLRPDGPLNWVVSQINLNKDFEQLKTLAKLEPIKKSRV